MSLTIVGILFFLTFFKHGIYLLKPPVNLDFLLKNSNFESVTNLIVVDALMQVLT